MPRHSSNTNLRLHSAETFQGLPVMVEAGALIEQYLQRFLRTIERAIDQYPRVFAFRVDLRLPLGVSLPEHAYTNEVINLFLESFKAKIKHDRQRAQARNQYAHDSRVRYFWAREVGKGERPHYHLLILLNADAYFTIGKKTSCEQNIFNRLQESWARALELRVSDVRGLVEIPGGAGYRLKRHGFYIEGLDEFFYRGSYLCKAATKNYGDGQHGFGCSQG